jgi:hypothetical protein
MSLCRLQPLSRGLGFCPACDPHARRPIPLGARRRCLGAARHDLPTIPLADSEGPGTILARLLKRFGIAETATCRCREMARKMDLNGPRWCRAHLDEIVEHLLREASRRKWMRYVPLRRIAAKYLVLFAIATAERRGAKQTELKSLPVTSTRLAHAVAMPRYDNHKTNVLSIVWRTGWQDIRRRVQFALGDRYAVHEVVSDQSPAMEAWVRALPEGSLVINHASTINATRFIAIVAARPDIQFIAVNHCSLNHAARWPQYFETERRLLEASETYENLHYSCPDPNVKWHLLGYRRTMWWPNPVFVPEDREPRRLDRPCIAIVGRDDFMKGFPSQIFAMGLLKRLMPELRCVAIINHAPAHWFGRELAASCRIDLEILPWLSVDDWYRFLREEASIILQCSLAESFNYVTVEAALHGRPFVASLSIRHCPSEWFADHSRPESIAERAIEILRNYEVHSRMACELGMEIADRQNREFVSMIERIVESTHK